MRDEITMKYTNGEITVVWKPDLCIHSALCWQGLQAVFNPQKKPWIDMDGAASDVIIAQVDQCPSGALSYFLNSEGAKESDELSQTVVEVLPDGPLIVHGDIIVKDRDGSEKRLRRLTAFCRCGRSNNKPFCDGSHVGAGFKG